MTCVMLILNKSGVMSGIMNNVFVPLAFTGQ